MPSTATAASSSATSYKSLVGPPAVTPEGTKLVYTEEFMGALLFTNGLVKGLVNGIKVPQQADVPPELRKIACGNIVMYSLPGSDDFEPGGIYRFWRKPNVTRATYTVDGETYVVDYTQFPPYSSTTNR